ncbi:MAG TPA: ribonuclease HII [Candidatus Limiplasma sp.]|nr:ribonuclease HII [Candidatus Limiplasma sp.]HPS80933.1 ribonuclease HII [Candidatus Limiplasma sp.]
MNRNEQKRAERSQLLVGFDQRYPAFGTSLAGMDEVGRGPLLGPVVTACVILPSEPAILWVDDSKKLSATRRESVYAQIMTCALYVGIGQASAEEIDRVNILNATKLAMRRAAKDAPATLCLVDAVQGLDLPFPTQPMIHGDATSYSIAAASIVAKVTRDRMMAELAQTYPQYGLERNMGYGTAEHIEAIRRFGRCPEHRLTFIQKWIAEAECD